ncbi:MAG: exodeoxyribonuclease VII small subunit [Microbacteriaceae bacterium]|jgi:exodeoxyribonuclease VII small subunit|nr:exodeoxyribonuclease VII small subunit [Microbacteriaceae bacterium]MCI1207615.1 exodeoxyribonuclease VII small subunit [Microbacteriaceae bacterium]
MTTQQQPDSVKGAADTDIASLSYEQARDELVQVLAQLEQGSPTLEASLGLWERGTALAARCEEWLTGAQQRLSAAQSRPTGVDTSPAQSDTEGGPRA